MDTMNDPFPRFSYRSTHWTANLDAVEALGLTAEQYDEIVDECSGGIDRKVGTNRVQQRISETLGAMQRTETEARLGGPAATPAQATYLRDLGASETEIATCTKTDASALIDILKARRGQRPSSRITTPADRARASAAYHGIDGEIWD